MVREGKIPRLMRAILVVVERAACCCEKMEVVFEEETGHCSSRTLGEGVLFREDDEGKVFLTMFSAMRETRIDDRTWLCCASGGMDR